MKENQLILLFFCLIRNRINRRATDVKKIAKTQIGNSFEDGYNSIGAPSDINDDQ